MQTPRGPEGIVATPAEYEDHGAVVSVISAGSFAGRHHAGQLARSTQRLSTGRRLNSVRDGVADYGRAQRLQAAARENRQAMANSRQAEDLLRLRETALRDRIDIVQRLRELAVRAAHGLPSSADRDALRKDADALVAQYETLGDWSFNGRRVLDDAYLNVGLGAGAPLYLSTTSSSFPDMGGYRYTARPEGGFITAGEVTVNGIDLGAISSSSPVTSGDQTNRSPFALEYAINALSADTGVTAEVRRATTAARYVRITLLATRSGSNVAQLAEIQNIYDQDGNSINQSNWSIATSSAVADQSLLLDGDNATLWLTGASESLPHTITIDMGAEHVVSYIQFRPGNGGSKPTDLRFETSLDGAQWTPAVEKQYDNPAIMNLFAGEVSLELSSNEPIVIGGTAPHQAFENGQMEAVLGVDPLDLEGLDLALEQLGLQAARVGAQLSQTSAVEGRLAVVNMTLEETRGWLVGADLAVETRRLSRAQVLQQVSVYVRGEMLRSQREIFRTLMTL